MKNFLYFIVGIIYLPIFMVIKVIIYIRDLGRIIDEYKFYKKFNNLKKTES